MRLRIASGSLCQFFQKKGGSSYPAISGDRDPNNLDHWYWVYSFKSLDEQGFLRTRSFSVPRDQVLVVRSMILNQSAISEIIAFLGKV